MGSEMCIRDSPIHTHNIHRVPLFETVRFSQEASPPHSTTFSLFLYPSERGGECAAPIQCNLDTPIPPMASSRSTGKRLPISCQACRTRKIRCSRDGRPCQTCVRRGLGAEDCIYLGQPRLSAEQSSPGDSAVQNELLARIRNLEGLLQKQMSSHAGTPTGGAVSPLGGTSAALSLIHI